jgi:methionyl-tRNA formyltransferase
MGTPEFAVPSLLCTAGSHDVVAVYTRSDAVSGRGRALRASPVKIAALEIGAAIRQPKTLRDPAEQEFLAALAPDVIAVAAYGLILPPEVLAIPRLGAVNVHASLLPRWRGAAPIQRAILAGDPETGVSIMRMEEGLDTGPYCLQATVAVDEHSAGELTSLLAETGAHALASALDAMESGQVAWTEQEPSQVTYAEKLTKADVRIEPDLDAVTALRRIRASSPSAPARIALGDSVVTVLEAAVSDSAPSPGRYEVDRTGFVLGVADGGVRPARIKPDGKAAMAADSWVRGFRGTAQGEWRSA